MRDVPRRDQDIHREPDGLLRAVVRDAKVMVSNQRLTMMEKGVIKSAMPEVSAQCLTAQKGLFASLVQFSNPLFLVARVFDLEIIYLLKGPPSPNGFGV